MSPLSCLSEKERGVEMLGGKMSIFLDFSIYSIRDVRTIGDFNLCVKSLISAVCSLWLVVRESSLLTKTEI